MRSIGLDIHHDFCEVAIAEAGRVRAAGRIGTAPDEIEAFAGGLRPDDAVTLEATGNALAIARLIEPHARVVLANPKATKAATRLRAKSAWNGRLLGSKIVVIHEPWKEPQAA